jgi:hypothetical protein
MTTAFDPPVMDGISNNESMATLKLTIGPVFHPQEAERSVQRIFPIRLAAEQDLLSKTTMNPPPLENLPPKLMLDEVSTLSLSDEITDDAIITVHERPETESSDNYKKPSVSTGAVSEHVSTSGTRYITNQFSFGPPKHGQPSTDVVGGERLYRCEDEPIHIPGAIQGFGALVAVREDENGHYIVRMASENTESVTGLDPEHLFGLQSFTDVLNTLDTAEFVIRVNALRSNTSRTDPDVYSLSISSSKGTSIPLFCAVHLNVESNLIVCEFELKKDVFNPRHPPDDGFPDVPMNVVDLQEATAEARLQSTISRSTPLHAVNIARKSSRQLGSMDLFHILAEIQKQMTSAPDLKSLLDILVGLVYELTSFHRVMVYQFDEKAAGTLRSQVDVSNSRT